LKKTSKKRNKEIVHTKFGTIIQDLKGEEKRALSSLLFSTTEPSESARQIPSNEIKKDHLLVKGINLVKNPQTGIWEVGLIITNQGNFSTSEAQTTRMSQPLIRSFVNYLKDLFEEDVSEYIKKEKL
jgi:hypothetical protein